MQVITIEEQSFKMLMERIDKLILECEAVNRGIYIESNKYLTAGQVGAITGYNGKTIKLRKDEIGFCTQGGLLKFLKSDVDIWMMKFYIPAK